MAKGTSEDKKKSKLPIIIVASIVIIGSVVLGGYLHSSQNKSEEEKVIVEAYSDLGEIFVNLNDESGKKYVKLMASVTYDSKNKKLVEELGLKSIELRDTAIFYFKSLGAEDFKVENEKVLKENLVAQLNKNLKSGKIIDIKFGELLIQ